MRRLLVVVTLGTALAALGSLACGSGSDKPPMTPDSDHPLADTDAAAPATQVPPATPSK